MNRWLSITYYKLTEALMAQRMASNGCDSKDSGKDKTSKKKEKDQESSKKKKENSNKKNFCGRDVLSTAPRCKDGKFPDGHDKGSKKKPAEKDQKKTGSSKNGGWFGKK